MSAQVSVYRDHQPILDQRRLCLRSPNKCIIKNKE
jgi:hypothetical protein